MWPKMGQDEVISALTIARIEAQIGRVASIGPDKGENGAKMAQDEAKMK